MATAKPLVVIVGETASGKSACALKLAEKFNGEIICADSRTIYKGMDIGTAKPTLAEQKRIRHHLIDLVYPNEHFTAAMFKQLAFETIADIHSKGKLPIMAGGTGLYIDSVIFDYDFHPIADPTRRGQLQKMSVEELQAQLEVEGIPLPHNERNPRHLIRALETGGVPAEKRALLPWTIVLGLGVEREEIKHRIVKRVEDMFSKGLEAEVRTLAQHYGWDNEALSAIGYREWQAYFEGRQTLAQTQELITKHTHQYAKRQRTWFKRNYSIQWLNDPSKFVDITTTFLNTLD